MNWAHVHIAINHTPIIGAVFAFVFLVYAMCRRNPLLEKTGLGILFLVGCAAVVTYLTGDPAADVAMRDVSDLSGAYVERHCDLAGYAMGFSAATGVCSVLGLVVWWRAKERAARWFVWASLVLSVVTLVLMAWTGLRGGEIRHTEIRPGAETSARPAGGE